MDTLDQTDLPLSIKTEEITCICNALEDLLKSRTIPACTHTFKGVTVTSDELLKLAKSLIKERSYRTKYFGDMDFFDPAWDILLDLYVCKETGRQVSVSSACIASNVPPTTALRYLSSMTDQGILIRVLDETDGRRIFVALSDTSHSLMRQYLCHVYESRHASL
jgi:DNA-binding MarR family transcriptional regulator